MAAKQQCQHPEHARLGSARLPLLFEMMLCFGCGPSCDALLGFALWSADHSQWAQ